MTVPNIPDTDGIEYPMGRKLRACIIPSTVRAAQRFVGEHHRHLPVLQGGLFACGVADSGEPCGVAIAGNPARVWQGTGRFVISRVATKHAVNDFGEHSAPYCSMLLSAICRAGAALGYREAWTYTLPEETGVSLRAAGFLDMGMTAGGDWGRPSRRRNPAVRPEPKRRWMRPLTAEARAAVKKAANPLHHQRTQHPDTLDSAFAVRGEDVSHDDEVAKP